MKKLLEVCVDSLASARAAQAGGADRLEFCSALAVGGLSPYPELLRQIKAECSLPVRCLMRPRRVTSFIQRTRSTCCAPRSTPCGILGRTASSSVR